MALVDVKAAATRKRATAAQAENLKYIHTELSKVTVQGERLPEAALKMTGR